jgi:recombination protein U
VVIYLQSNRGRYLEDMINQSNVVYETKGLAIVRKIPTPWKVQRKYNPYLKTYEIAFAYPERKSSVDFGGMANKQSIWFEAKSSNHEKHFPLINIHDHQMDYLRKIENQGGKAFFIVYSEHLNKTWILWIDVFLKFLTDFKRKSIPWEWFNQNCAEIKPKNGVALDYLTEVLHRKE